MKKFLVYSLFGVSLCLAPWACTKPFPINPVAGLTSTPTTTHTSIPTVTATPTLITTPICGFSSITLPGFNSAFSFMTPTPGCSTAPAIGSMYPVTTIMGGLPIPVFVIQNQAQWLSFYGCSNPPPAPTVDFTAQMVILLQYQGCFDSPGFANVCETSNGVTISIQDMIHEPQCMALTIPPSYMAITAPNSNLPISWQIGVTVQ